MAPSAEPNDPVPFAAIVAAAALIVGSLIGLCLCTCCWLIFRSNKVSADENKEDIPRAIPIVMGSHVDPNAMVLDGHLMTLEEGQYNEVIEALEDFVDIDLNDGDDFDVVDDRAKQIARKEREQATATRSGVVGAQEQCNYDANDRAKQIAKKEREQATVTRSDVAGAQKQSNYDAKIARNGR
jgi:hypothetical protein